MLGAGLPQPRGQRMRRIYMSASFRARAAVRPFRPLLLCLKPCRHRMRSLLRPAALPCLCWLFPHHCPILFALRCLSAVSSRSCAGQHFEPESRAPQSWMMTLTAARKVCSLAEPAQAGWTHLSKHSSQSKTLLPSCCRGSSTLRHTPVGSTRAHVKRSSLVSSESRVCNG